MPRTVLGGPLDGHTLRRSRRRWHCSDYRHCGNEIAPGHFYVETEVDPDLAGGFGMKKLCMSCAGEAIAAMKAPETQT